MDESNDQRSDKARAYHWASRVMSISVGLIVPCVIGYVLDRKFGWRPTLAIVGLVLGMVIAGFGLADLTKSLNDGAHGARRSKKDPWR